MDDKQKQEGAAYDSNLTVEWLTWRSRFQRTMENTFNMKPSVQDVDYFMLSLLRRIEKETVEEFREPKAQCFLDPALASLRVASYCFLSTRNQSSFSQNAIPEHVEAFFDHPKIKEEYRLAKSWYLQKLLEIYETTLKDFSTAVVPVSTSTPLRHFTAARSEARRYFLFTWESTASGPKITPMSWRKTPISRKSTPTLWKSFVKLPETSITTSANASSPKGPRLTIQ